MLSKFSRVAFFLFLVSCATPPPEKPLTISEQIHVDTAKLQSFRDDFEMKNSFIELPKTEKYLTSIAIKLAKQESGFASDEIRVEVHNDQEPKLRRFFSFPGTLISVPVSFLRKVEFENELAAALSLEIAHVVNRHLANDLEKSLDFKELFHFTDEQREQSIKLGSKFLYYAGFDLRGMASIFDRYAEYYVNQGTSELNKKEVAFNIRTAQRARSEYLPSLKPIVRSAEFIQFKKELQRKE